MACAHWPASVVAVARSAGTGCARRREGGDRHPDAALTDHQGQAGQARVAVLLQARALCRVLLTPLALVGEPHLLPPAHRVGDRVAGVERHAPPPLLGAVLPVVHLQAHEHAVAQLPRGHRLDVEQLPQLGDHDGADLLRGRGRGQRRRGVLQQPQPVVGRPLTLQQLLPFGLGAAARGDVAADRLQPPVPGGAHAQLQRDPPAVPVTHLPHLGQRLPVVHRLQLRHEPRQLVGRNDVLDAQGQVLRAGVAEHLAGRGIHVQVAPVLVDEPDPVRRPLDEQPVALLVLAQRIQGVHPLHRLPAAGDDGGEQVDLRVGPHPWASLVHGHGGDEPARLVQRHADDRRDPGAPVDVALLRQHPLVGERVRDDVRLAGAHAPQGLGAEVRHRHPPVQRRQAPRVAAGHREVVFVRLRLGVGAAVAGELLADEARHRRHDLRRVVERLQRAFDPRQEEVATRVGRGSGAGDGTHVGHPRRVRRGGSGGGTEGSRPCPRRRLPPLAEFA